MRDLLSFPTRRSSDLGASGVVPLGLVLVGRLFPYERRGRPLGWLFGAMAGGMAFGSTFGALLEPVVGWHGRSEEHTSELQSRQQHVCRLLLEKKNALH